MSEAPRTLADRLADDLVTLDAELSEVDLLITQARTEAARHDSRRVAASEKVDALGPDGDAGERLELTTNLVLLTKRAALMESQVDVLEGKRRALARFRDGVASYLEAGPDAGGVPGGASTGLAIEGGGDGDAGSGAGAPGEAPSVSRLVLSAQEDLRREIARAMHDGPAQSLTNIVLQAQIVDRLVERDPANAGAEVKRLIAMVQQTLDATKSFIFDVRPMVLDDLGLVPTLRRATRERSRRAGIPVEFESLGNDRRLPMDLESGFFRLLDEALVAYLAETPDSVALRLDWGDGLEARLVASRAVVEVAPDADAVPVGDAAADAKDLPPALAAMLEERRVLQRKAAEEAVREAVVQLPAGTWREISARAASLGIAAELLSDGAELRLAAAAADVAEAPATDGEAMPKSNAPVPSD